MSPGVVVSTAVDCAHPFHSSTKSTGACSSAAKVSASVQAALAERPVPDLRDRDSWQPLSLPRPRPPGREERRAALNAGAEEVRVVEMLGAAAPAAEPALLRHQLAEERLERAAGGQIPAVSPMAREHGVVGLEAGRARTGAEFLADVGVDRAGQPPFLEEIEQLELECPGPAGELQDVIPSRDRGPIGDGRLGGVVDPDHAASACASAAARAATTASWSASVICG